MIDGVTIGIIAGIVGIGGFVYQSWKNPIGTSWPMIVFVGASISLWAGYGLAIEDPIMYVPNLILVCMFSYNAYRKLSLA